jgi:uncharacterized integral membrane protein
VAAGVFLILRIIFIAQNLNDAPIHFLGLNGQVSIGLALLLAGVCGLIIAAVPASARIWQLRKALKKTRVTIFRRRRDSGSATHDVADRPHRRSGMSPPRAE